MKVPRDQSWSEGGAPGGMVDEEASLMGGKGSTSSSTATGTGASDAQPPLDKYRLAYALLWLEGLGMLFPWNVFITAEAYFHRRFCGTSFENNFLNFFGLCFMGCNVLGLAISVKWGGQCSVRKRVNIPLIINCLVFMFTTVLTFFAPETMNSTNIFWVTLFTVGTAGFCNAILQGGVFGTAGQLPGLYTQAIMGGQGLAGLLVALSSILTTVSGSEAADDICLEPYNNLQWPAFAYFFIACLIIVGAAIGWAVFERLDFVQFYVQQAAAKESRKPLLVNGGEGASDVDPATRTLLTPNKRPGVWMLLQQLGPLTYAIWLCFAVTLNVFPSVTAKVQSTTDSDSRFFSDLWVPFSFFGFNLWDFVGRAAAGAIQIIPNTKRGHKMLAFLCTLRLVFIPLFLWSSVAPPKGHTTSIVPYFTNDAFPLLWMFLFALTNGYFSSLIMMYGPSQCSDAPDVAGTIMVFLLTVGLLTGSLSSFGWISVFPEGPASNSTTLLIMP